MYKVLIIDDEEPVRDAIKILGKWEDYNISQIFEAANGRDGMNLVSKECPDIVFVDMRMPEMDGLEFLKILQTEYPHIQIIVVSGYNSFEYARQALQSKAIDYLLKPINKGELNNAIKQCINVISERKKDLNQKIGTDIMLNVSLPVLKEKVFISIIQGNFEKEDKELYLSIINDSENIKRYGVALIRILNMRELVYKKFAGNVQLMQEACINVINEICNEKMECFCLAKSELDSEIITIISYKNDDSTDDSVNYNGTIKKVFQKIKELFNVKLAVCIGKSCASIEGIKESYQYAKIILDNINVINMKEDIYCEAPKKDKLEASSIISNINLMKDAFEKGIVTYANSILGGYINKLKESNYLSFKDAHKIIKEFIILLGDISISMGLPNDIFSEENIKKEIRYCYDFSTFQEFEKTLYNILEFFFINVKKVKAINKNLNISIREIKEYIDKNYSQEIKISIFTEKYFLSREYVMKLFKQEYGYGIHEYVQYVRMEKAKELLNEEEVKIQSISQILGYSDTNYFSKAFKNYYGTSPTEYRLRILNK